MARLPQGRSSARRALGGVGGPGEAEAPEGLASLEDGTEAELEPVLKGEGNSLGCGPFQSRTDPSQEPGWVPGTEGEERAALRGALGARARWRRLVEGAG